MERRLPHIENLDLRKIQPVQPEVLPIANQLHDIFHARKVALEARRRVRRGK